MRELKFRAWDGQQMLSWDVVRKEHLDGLEDDLWQWMQFTGLTDRHGVEIWEGDIVLRKGESVEDDSIMPVEWMTAHGGWCRTFQDIDKKVYGIGLGESDVRTLSVIGNVHEHAHLLEQPQPSDTDASGNVG